MSGIVYVVLRIAIQYQVSHARPGAGILSTPYEAHVGCLVTSLYNRMNVTDQRNHTRITQAHVSFK